MPHPRPNWRRLDNGDYLVRTQAGFKQALHDHFDESQLNQIRPIVGHPKVYPSVVRFNYLHGWNEPQAHCTPINQYKAELAALMADLADE